MNVFKTYFGEIPDASMRVELKTDEGSFFGETEKEVEDRYHKYMMENDREYKVKYDMEMILALDVKEVKTKNFSTGLQSLVGVGKDYPVSWGNYWSIIIDPDRSKPVNENIEASYPALNIWCENWEEAVKRFKITELHAYIVNGLCVIINKEIPDDWYLDDLFMKYNIGRGMSKAEKDKLNKWYGELDA